ncbi:ATP-dependent DNA helicase [Mycena chlorophos]|uniref:ATP-dependent DNA helicase n=1 Tax=Mycena chlorophos TaxID=658473 RepID=A0A8H6VNF0_MYCCL|nr:ATP-dependent DNA helicase [Mycena chlorophos]
MFLCFSSRISSTFDDTGWADALRWLKENNPIYANVEISAERLAELPVSGIPDEILLNVRYAPDQSILDREHAGYVPVDLGDDLDDDDDPEDGVQSRPTVNSDGVECNHEDPEEEVVQLPEVADGEERDMDVDVPERRRCYQSKEKNKPELMIGVSSKEHIQLILNLHRARSVPVASPRQRRRRGDGIPEDQLFANAVRRLQPAGKKKPDYGVRPGSSYINEYPRETNGQRTDGGIANPNHLLGAFPCLFPYGYGGLEVDRQGDVPYATHIRWCLQYDDARFRRDLHFVFQVFGVDQKRKAAGSACIQVRTSTYHANEAAFHRLRAEDFVKASKEEAQRLPISNPIIRSLRKQLTAVRARVMGTDESRIAIRAQVWGMILQFNPPTLWMTVNLSDTGCPSPLDCYPSSDDEQPLVELSDEEAVAPASDDKTFQWGQLLVDLVALAKGSPCNAFDGATDVAYMISSPWGIPPPDLLKRWKKMDSRLLQRAFDSQPGMALGLGCRVTFVDPPRYFYHVPDGYVVGILGAAVDAAILRVHGTPDDLVFTEAQNVYEDHDNGHEWMVSVEDTASGELVDVELHHVQRRFVVGDSVRVVEGFYEGRTGNVLGFETLTPEEPHWGKTGCLTIELQHNTGLGELEGYKLGYSSYLWPGCVLALARHQPSTVRHWLCDERLVLKRLDLSIEFIENEPWSSALEKSVGTKGFVELETELTPESLHRKIDLYRDGDGRRFSVAALCFQPQRSCLTPAGKRRGLVLRPGQQERDSTPRW